MMMYQFYDTDSSGTKDWDIQGVDYQKLIHTCAQYTTIISMRVTYASNPYLHQMERFRLYETDGVEFAYKHYYSRDDEKAREEVWYYRLCPEVMETLLHISDSVFKWINAWGYQNPEDLVFYREDGTIFFDSIVHEGVCRLYPRDDEDVQHIVQTQGWNKVIT